jgi:hypothetical protein
MHQARKSRNLMRRFRANGNAWHAIHFAKGVLIGGIIVVLVGLMAA